MKGGLLFDLRRLHLAVEQAGRPQLEPLGLTSAQAVVLGWLLEPGHGEVCASHLHRQTGLSRAAISATAPAAMRISGTPSSSRGRSRARTVAVSYAE